MLSIIISALVEAGYQVISVSAESEFAHTELEFIGPNGSRAVVQYSEPGSIFYEDQGAIFISISERFSLTIYKEETAQIFAEAIRESAK